VQHIVACSGQIFEIVIISIMASSGSRWKGRVALVTGASSGIGEEACKALASEECGMKVVGCARRVEKIQALAEKHPELKIHAYKCDVGNEEEVAKMFDWIESHPDLGQVDVCVPNAGFSDPASLMEGTVDQWRQMLNVNVVGLTQCTQLALKSMLKHKIDDGTIVLVNSMSGHRIPISSKLKFYSATKFAVTALLEGFRQEIRQMEPANHIRIAQICPGLVATEFGAVAGSKEMFDKFKDPLTAPDMADLIKYIVQSPPHVQIHDIMVRPTNQLF